MKIARGDTAIALNKANGVVCETIWLVRDLLSVLLLIG
jgi:hypothetical protein